MVHSRFWGSPDTGGVAFELHELAGFLAVIDNVSVVAAAARLRIAQPALTRKIHHLEQKLGVELFKRGHNEMRLTRAGERLALDARYILNVCRFVEVAVPLAEESELEAGDGEDAEQGGECNTRSIE